MRGVWGPSFCGKCKRASNGQLENRESLTLPRRFLIPQANPPIIEFLKRFVKESRLCLTFNTIYARPFQDAGTKEKLKRVSWFWSHQQRPPNPSVESSFLSKSMLNRFTACRLNFWPTHHRTAINQTSSLSASARRMWFIIPRWRERLADGWRKERRIRVIDRSRAPILKQISKPREFRARKINNSLH